MILSFIKRLWEDISTKKISNSLELLLRSNPASWLALLAWRHLDTEFFQTPVPAGAVGRWWMWSDSGVFCEVYLQNRALRHLGQEYLQLEPSAGDPEGLPRKMKMQSGCLLWELRDLPENFCLAGGLSATRCRVKLQLDLRLKQIKKKKCELCARWHASTWILSRLLYIV